jgi:hypothetical protein
MFSRSALPSKTPLRFNLDLTSIVLALRVFASLPSLLANFLFECPFCKMSGGHIYLWGQEATKPLCLVGEQQHMRFYSGGTHLCMTFVLLTVLYSSANGPWRLSFECAVGGPGSLKFVHRSIMQREAC